MAKSPLDEASRKRARAAFTKLLARYHGQYAELARELGTTRQVVRKWDARGYVSSPAAFMLDNLGLAKREELRPDVVNWHHIETSVLKQARETGAYA